MPFLPLLEPNFLPTPIRWPLCCLRLSWDQSRCFPWRARRVRACNVTASWRTLSPSLHFEMDPSPLVEVLEDSPSIVVEFLDACDLGAIWGLTSSNHANGWHVEPWLGSNSIDPYKFNNHKRQLVAQEKVLGLGDVFLIIQVNRHLPPTRSYRSPWQTWGYLRKGNHPHVYCLELEARFIVNKALMVSLWVCEVTAVTTEDPQQHTIQADLNTNSVTWGTRKKHDLEGQTFCCLWSKIRQN